MLSTLGSWQRRVTGRLSQYIAVKSSLIITRHRHLHPFSPTRPSSPRGETKSSCEFHGWVMAPPFKKSWVRLCFRLTTHLFFYLEIKSADKVHTAVMVKAGILKTMYSSILVPNVPKRFVRKAVRSITYFCIRFVTPEIS